MSSSPATTRRQSAEQGVAFRSDDFRPELQVLRAAAVLLVLGYHFWPDQLPGGFVGVDVFFVVSGFLITAHLLSAFDRDGRVSLPAFWARRARRLLPSSLVVLAVTALGTLAFAPAVTWQQTFKEIAASALYVQNWALAADSVDYLAADNAPSPAQHFWSLSVEEQFYLTVPVLLVIAALVAGSAASVMRRRAFLATALGVVTVASFVACVVLTVQAPGPAYFITPTRAWEFAGGGLLSFGVGWFVRQSPALRAAAAWVGWVGIILSAFVITGSTPFPGYAAALPVVAAGVIIAAGRAPVRWAPDRFLAVRPVIFVGDISYATYLWHWPALILAQYTFGRPLPDWLKVSIVAGVIAASWATTRFVENPVRRGRLLTSRRPLYTFAATVLAVALVAVPTVAGWSLTRDLAATELQQSAEVVAKAGDCIGAGSRDPAINCAPDQRDQLIPDPSAAIDDKASAYDGDCISGVGIDSAPVCTAGVTDGPVRVLVIGDSHVVHWLPALQAIADDRGWSITTYLKSACSYSTALNIVPPQSRIETCRDWNVNVTAMLAASDPFELVFVSNSIQGNVYASDADAISGYRAAWRTLTKRGAVVVVVHDTPRVPETTAGCLERHEADPDQCSIPEAEALAPVDPMVEAAANQPHVRVLDFTDYFCWDGTCKTAIGGVVVYRDVGHITATFATTFGPVIGRQLDALGL